MYRKQASILKSYPVEITNVRQMYDAQRKRAPYFNKTIDKIEEILTRGTTSKLEELKFGAEGRRRLGRSNAIPAVILIFP